MKCDEMKAYIGPNTIDHTITEYYRHILFKSEADKVIAELKQILDIYCREEYK